MEDVKTDALAFLKRNRTGVIATAGHDNLPHISVIHYICDDKFNIYFLTHKNTRKYKSIIAHPQVAFTVFTEGAPQSIEVEGMAADISDSIEAGSKKDELFEVLMLNPVFNPPISKLDTNDTAVVWIKPSWVRWADFAFAEEGNENVLQNIDMSA